MDEISRRKFIGWMTGAGAGAVLAPYARIIPGLENLVQGPPRHAEAAGAAEGTTRDWVMVIDLKKCEGCETVDDPPQCLAACREEHFVPDSHDWIKLYERGDAGGGTYFQPSPCMQCANAPCVNVCPVGATYHSEEGVVLIDHNRCIGCRFCIAACPYDARSFNWDEPEQPPQAALANYSPEYPLPHQKGTVAKCMFCAHRLRDGKLPACADACPMGAIYMGDRTTDVATNGQEVVRLSNLISRSQGYREKEELGTEPRVYYLPGHGQEYGRRAK